MKVIFRSNDLFANETLGQLGGAEEWLASLGKFLSEEALLRLSLFIETNDVTLATLDIVDGSLHVHSSVKDNNQLTAIESVINKCAVQLKKNKRSYGNKTIRYNDKMSFDSLQEAIELHPSINEQFKMLDVKHSLETEKKTPKYNRIMNKYVNFLYIDNDIEQAEEHLRVLYSILDNVDLEEISVAEYVRLTESIVQIEKERNSMIEKQTHFETDTKDKLYIDQVIEKEAKLAKLKK